MAHRQVQKFLGEVLRGTNSFVDILPILILAGNIGCKHNQLLRSLFKT